MHQDAWKTDEYIRQRDKYILLACLLCGIFLTVRAEQRLGFSQIQSENQKQCHELNLETKMEHLCSAAPGGNPAHFPPEFL